MTWMKRFPRPGNGTSSALAASVVLAGRHIQLKQSESARAARAAVRFLPGTHGGVRLHEALDVWYDRIDLERCSIAHADDERRARVIERTRRAGARAQCRRARFPEAGRARGATPRIKDNPPLIFHSPEHREGGAARSSEAAWALYHDSLPEHVRVLFDRFHLCDMAVKVVGVGSVGTLCMIALFMAADDDPLFLQIKEANASVLEPYAGQESARQPRSARRRWPAADAGGERHLPGVDQGKRGRHFYVRQLRDMKSRRRSSKTWTMNRRLTRKPGACGWALARAHARLGQLPR